MEYRQQLRQRIKEGLKRTDNDQEQSIKASRTSQQISLVSKSRSRRQFDTSNANKEARLLPSCSVGKVRKKNNTRGSIEEIEFNNMKWISIISAYDEKRLKYVTISKESCQKFLKKCPTILKRSAEGTSQFYDMKKNFRCWLDRINDGYFRVLDQFLRKHKEGFELSISRVAPALQDIRYDTEMMKQKLQACVDAYEHREFRILADKFKAYLHASDELQDVIEIMLKSRSRIEDLFKELQRGRNIEKKVEKIYQSGMSEVKYVVGQADRNAFASRIVEKVAATLKEMASKSVDCFHKLQGMRELLIRMTQCLSSEDCKDIATITTMNKIFQEILQQSTYFEEFATRFLEQSEMMNDDLRQFIRRNLQELRQKRKNISQIQFSFVAHTLSEAIHVLRHYSSVNAIFVEHKHPNGFMKSKLSSIYLLLESIADSMDDANRKAVLVKFLQESRVAIARVDEQIERIKKIQSKTSRDMVLDREEGFVTVLQYSKTVTEYKQKVKTLMQRHQTAARSLNISAKLKEQTKVNTDEEEEFLEEIVKLSEQINSRSRNEQLRDVPLLSAVPQKTSILQVAGKSGVTPVLDEMASLHDSVCRLRAKGALNCLIEGVSLEEPLFCEAKCILKCHGIAHKTTEKNILDILAKIAAITEEHFAIQTNQGRHYKPSSHFVNAIEHLSCLLLVKGVPAAKVKELDTRSLIKMPEGVHDVTQTETEIKYFSLILQGLSACSKLKTVASQRLSEVVSLKKCYVEVYSVISQLQSNDQQRFYLSVSSISAFINPIFSLLFKEAKPQFSRMVSAGEQLAKKIREKQANLGKMDANSDVDDNQSALRIRKAILVFQNANSNALSLLQTLIVPRNIERGLEQYASLMAMWGEYVRDTQQKAYFALDCQKHVIWLSACSSAEKGAFEEWGLHGFKRGIYCDSYSVAQAEVNLTLFIPQKTEKCKQKVGEEPVEQIAEDTPMEQIGDQQMASQIIDGIAEDIGDIQEIQDIAEEGEVQEMEDISDEQIEEEQEPETKKDESKAKKDEPKTIMREPLKSTFQMLSSVNCLSGLRKLFVSLSCLDEQFWEGIELRKIERWFNSSEGEEQLRRELVRYLDVYINGVFLGQYRKAIEASQEYKSVRACIDSLLKRDKGELLRLLNKLGKQHSVLLHESLLLSVAIGTASNFDPRACILSYAQRSDYSLRQFDLQKYISNCMAVSTCGLTTTYTPLSPAALPTQHTVARRKEAAQLIQHYLCSAVDLAAMSALLWSNALDTRRQWCFKEMDTLLEAQEVYSDAKWIGYYHLVEKQRVDQVVRDANAQTRELENLFAAVSSANILPSLARLAALHSQQPLIRYYVTNTQLCFLSSAEETPPVQTPPVQTPPVQTPPVQTPPGQTPPVQTPPGQTPPVQTPPGQTAFEKEIRRLFTSQFQEAIPGGDRSTNMANLLAILRTMEGDVLRKIVRVFEVLRINCFFMLSPLKGVSDRQEGLVMSLIEQVLPNTLIQSVNMKQLIRDIFEPIQLSFVCQMKIKQGMFPFSKEGNAEAVRTLHALVQEYDSVHRDLIGSVPELGIHDYIWNRTGNLLETMKKLHESYGSLQYRLKEVERAYLQTYLVEYQEKRERTLQAVVSKSTVLAQLLIELEFSRDNLSKMKQISQFFIELFPQNIVTLRGIRSTSTYIISMRVTPHPKPQYSDLLGKLYSYLAKGQPSHQRLLKDCLQHSLHTYVQVNPQSRTITFDLAKIEEKLLEYTLKPAADRAQLHKFVRQFNVNRFNPLLSDPTALEQLHTSILARLKHYQQSVVVAGLLKDYLRTKGGEIEYHGINSSNIAECVEKTERMISKREKKDKDGKESYGKFWDWFKLVVVKLMEVEFYTVRSSQNNIIACFSVLGQNPLQQVALFLQEINIPKEYDCVNVDGYHLVNLRNQVITCSIPGLTSTEFAEFKEANYGLPPDVTWILGYYQEQGTTQIPLTLQHIQVDLVACRLQLSENATLVDVTCFVSKISKAHYQESIGNKQQLASKAICMSSPEDTIQGVKIGDKLQFQRIGIWLKQQYDLFKQEQIRKEEIRKEETKKEELEKRRIEQEKEEQKKQTREQIKEQTAAFLEGVYADVQKQHVGQNRVSKQPNDSSS